MRWDTDTKNYEWNIQEMVVWYEGIRLEYVWNIGAWNIMQSEASQL